MALLFVKSLLFSPGASLSRKYSPVLPKSEDIEHGQPSTDANDDGMSSDFDDEKPSHYNTNQANSAPSTTARINPRIISDATIGLSDGLTVPFALTAGLSALGNTNVVIYGGLAELIAGGISMGLGGFLGAKSEAEAYAAALADTTALVATHPDRAAHMARESFERYDFAELTLDGIADRLLAQPDRMVDFLMRFHHQLAEADYAPSRAYVSGVTISLGYFFGGLVPLLPYLFFADVQRAFVASVIVMAAALFVFGWGKTALVGEGSRWICAKNGAQMMMLGGVAAGAAMGCVKAVGS